MIRINIIIDIGSEQFEVNLTDENSTMIRNGRGELVVQAPGLREVWEKAVHDGQRWLEIRTGGNPGGNDGTDSCGQPA